jgi:Ca2+-binding EF-hand superfamily protein
MASAKAKAATAAKKEDPPKEAKVEEKKEDDSGAKAHRATSNVFSMFQQSQIQEFKEAFTLIDNDRDGVISDQDLKAIFSSVGREPSENELKEMLKECPGQLNFTAFLTLFGEKMHGTDPESTLRSAFAMFDREGKGFIPEDYLKDLLTNTGDQFKENELKAMWKEAPVSGGLFDYNAYVTLIKRGNQND